MKLCGFEVGRNQPLFLIAGPCVIESEQFVVDVAGELKEICQRLDIPFIFKASFDKANRSSVSSFRGPGLQKGLEILTKVKEIVDVPVLTDVHEMRQIEPVAAVVDVLQTPAFLCRQTDFIQAIARTLKPVNIKKGQFLSPNEMNSVVEKAKQAAILAGGDGQNIMVCERGYTFGYNNLVSDMRSLVIMQDTGCPVVYDGTHSVQLPGGLGKVSGGNREFIPPLCRAATAVGISGLFLETHPEPDNALSDGPNSWPLSQMEWLLSRLIEIDKIAKESYRIA
jgi:2-dehydro-3-deoxyphosphooctonate aldolase (KDO 8-P synthase)